MASPETLAHPSPLQHRSEPIRVGIVGGSGYAGGELLRLLLAHPATTLAYVASRSLAGEPLAASHPALLGYTDLVYQPLDPEAIARSCDVLFTAVPHGASMGLAAQMVEAGVKVIDIGTDFRFKDPARYREWYGIEHTESTLLDEAIYGLCEYTRDAVREARVVGNPGCYPTATLLGLLPLAEAGLIEREGIVVNALSGVSGAGSTPKAMYHFPERTENTQAYGVAGHRHTGEIEAQLAALSGREIGALQFTPHLVPMSRGILSTITAPAAAGATEQAVLAALHARYDAEPFVQVLGEGELPQTKAVSGSNQCHLTGRYDARTGNVIVVSAIDNLVKGASGQAVQNLNLMFGLDEALGLRQAPLLP